ncbi:MAG: amino acid-binding ACT [Gemmataceae bacterium]
MAFRMSRVHVFHTQVEDKPGGIAEILKQLAQAGAHLEYVYSQRSITKPGYGELYVAPLLGTNAVAAAKTAGLHEVDDPVVMRVEGDDKAGLSGRLTMAWEMAGLNLHGLVLSVLAGKFVGYVTFDSTQDANKAATILAELGCA